MKIGSLELTLHRTVRVPEGRQPANLPPSLGRMDLFRVSDYTKNCPKHWEKNAFFACLHDTEAMWMSFHPTNGPVAILVGAGGINALTGEKLGTTLEKDNYCVAPPQPWLDGWKDKDGTVYQFVATPYKKGEGITVAEQLIGKESKTGAIGVAIFEPKDRAALKTKILPHEWNTSSMLGGGGSTHYNGIKGQSVNCSVSNYATTDSLGETEKGYKPSGALTRSLKSFSEMGVGKGGKIIQKIYPDPHGLDVWREKPEGTLGLYLVNAMVFESITGIKTPVPVGHETYDGAWFGMHDKQEGDVSGTDKFTGLKSAVFPASNLPEAKPEKKKKKVAVTK